MLRIKLLPALLMLGALPALSQTHTDDSIRMNQIQVIGSHNSYHAGFAPSEAKYWKQQKPEMYRHLDYHHPPLPQQFDEGIRQIEIDTFADMKGGRYAHPAGLALVQKAGLPSDPPFDPNGVMLKPGFKVMHVQDVDYRSVCQPFTECLRQVRSWSRSHPDHIPIFVIIETKQDNPAPGKLINAEPYTAATWDALDAAIRSVFPANELITPDDVRGSYATLNEAIRKHGWPTLAKARGKVIFLMDQRNVEQAYLAGHPSLRGRVLFTNAAPGAPDAAFTEVNDVDVAKIQPLVREGYLVRTRTDADTEEARANDTRHRTEAMESGAQILSTDYWRAEPASWTGYSVGFKSGTVARCNPVDAPSTCTDSGLEPQPSQAALAH